MVATTGHGASPTSYSAVADPFPTIERPPVDGDQVNGHLWPFLGLLAERFPGEWVLIGGQMVLLHGMENGQLPVRETNDADALVDVRVAPRGTVNIAAALTEMGLELEGINTGGIGHRFVGRGLVVDLLAPDHLGERATLTTIPPARTVQVPAGTRLLHAPRRCPVSVAGQVHWMPRPDLSAAIVGKAAALSLPDSRRHAEDLAFLCGLVADPREVDAVLTNSDRRWLIGAEPLLDEERVWTYAADPDRARSTLMFLLRDRSPRQGR